MDWNLRLELFFMIFLKLIVGGIMFIGLVIKEVIYYFIKKCLLRGLLKNNE